MNIIPMKANLIGDDFKEYTNSRIKRYTPKLIVFRGKSKVPDISVATAFFSVTRSISSETKAIV